MAVLNCSGQVRAAFCAWNKIRGVQVETPNAIRDGRYVILYLLTPWSRVLPEKLTVPQLLTKFPAFYETRRFITAFTRARHLSLSWAISIQFMPHLTSRRSILILTSHLRLGLPSSLLPSSVNHQTPICTSSRPKYMLHALPISIFLVWSPEWYLVRCTEHIILYYIIL